MRGIRHAVAIITLALGAATTARAQAGADSTRVAAVVRQFHDALLEGDSASAANLLAPDATILESGDEESRAAYVGHHLGEDIAYARAVRSKSSAIRVAVQGDVAWASSLSSARGRFNGRTVNSSGAELMVLSRVRDSRTRTDVWKIRAIHWSSHRKAN